MKVVPAMALIVPLARAAVGALAWPLGAGEGQDEVSAAALLPAAAVGAGTGVFVADVPLPHAARRSTTSVTVTAVPGLNRMAKNLP